jgi:catechol 2,3-dioxygenase-like lactoylglutathione lyase family enzyme
MEAVIARMLGDFENGRLTRRELIQTLAMMVATGPTNAAVQQGAKPAPPISPAFAPTGWKTVSLDHISFAVSDYRRSVAFYRDLMGWTISEESGTNQATLDINGLGAIIIRSRPTQQAQAAAPQPGVAASASAASPAAIAAAGGGAQGSQQNRPSVTGVINHISWGISPWDTDKVKTELERRGLNPRPDNQGQNYKSYHVLDPDGWDLQISNHTKL